MMNICAIKTGYLSQHIIADYNNGLIVHKIINLLKVIDLFNSCYLYKHDWYTIVFNLNLWTLICKCEINEADPALNVTQPYNFQLRQTKQEFVRWHKTDSPWKCITNCNVGSSINIIFV